MKTDALVKRWQAAIVAECETKLGRSLTAQEKQFIVSRGGLIALEMIQETVRDLAPSDLADYLNSEIIE